MEKGKRREKAGKAFFCELLTLLLAAVLAGICSRFWFQLMLIRGQSMAPAYHDLQFAVIDKRGEDYSYGDVIAFRCEELSAVLVKRVAACPGDEVQIKEGTLLVNGRPSAVFPQEITCAGVLEHTVRLGEDQYIVLGDNLAESKDSRHDEVGVVRAEDIIGKLL